MIQFSILIGYKWQSMVFSGHKKEKKRKAGKLLQYSTAT